MNNCQTDIVKLSSEFVMGGGGLGCKSEGDASVYETRSCAKIKKKRFSFNKFLFCCSRTQKQKKWGSYFQARA